jgi:enoyl-CoA hydratase
MKDTAVIRQAAWVIAWDEDMRSTQTLGPILDGAMRNTPEGREFVRVTMAGGVKAAVEKRDGPFGDYSKGSREAQPRKRSEIE